MPIERPAARPPVPAGPYLVVGLGRAGLAAANALCDLVGPDQVWGCDLRAPESSAAEIAALRARGVTLHTASDGLRELGTGTACVVKSPGVPFDAAVIARANELGMPVIDELELGWRIGSASMVSVTGTNGKSTVCALLAAVSGAPVVGNTQFGAPLSAVARERPARVICETSSYQLEGSPTLLPDIAVLTNLRSDHLARHPTVEAYAACKRRLFVRGDRAVPVGVLNVDESFGRALAAEVAQNGGRVVTFGSDRDAAYRLLACGWTIEGGWAEVDTPDGPVRLDSRLPGPHNARNVIAALAAGRASGFALERTVRAIGTADRVPGRFEQIKEGQPFDVVVDFAHTPDAVEAVMQTARGIASTRDGAKVHAVLGDAGHRPKQLRVPLGLAAAGFADRLIVTEGNRRGEPLAGSLVPLLRGARSARRAEVELVLGRREAIRHVLATAAERDLVVLLGRGAQSWIQPDTSRPPIPFDDRVVAREELRRLLALDADQPRTATTSA